MTWTDGVRPRLAELAAADPECTAFGVSRHRYQLGPALSESEVAAFEQSYGITLPAEYREFVRRVGNGGAGPCYGLYQLDGAELVEQNREDWLRPEHFATPFPHTEFWNPNSPELTMTDDEYFDPKWDTGSIIIDHYGCGHFYRLIVTGPARGQVWFDGRASDEGLTPGPDFTTWYLDWLNKDR
ncbi:MAG TPA: SMI1/KNR4 family protein [Pseudonocardiaceae bacterium]